MVKNTPLQIFATYNDEKFKILKRLKKKKKKKIENNILEDIRNLFRLKKRNR